VNSSIEIDTKLRSLGQEVLRRRLLGGEVKSDLRNTLAELCFAKMYGRSIDLDEFQPTNNRYLNYIPEDDKGCLIRVVNRLSPPYKVYERQTDVDVIVFCTTSKDFKTCEFHGWLDVAEIKESPGFWFEENGERTEYCYEVDKAFLYDMPESCNFNINCDHRFGTWDYLNSGWACPMCEKLCYDIKAYRKINESAVA
jgi:hypothetical protein